MYTLKVDAAAKRRSWYHFEGEKTIVVGGL